MFTKKIILCVAGASFASVFNAQKPIDEVLEIDGCDSFMCEINSAISGMFAANDTANDEGDSDDGCDNGMCTAAPSTPGMCGMESPINNGMCGMEPPKRACCGMCAGNCGGAGKKTPISDDSDDSDL